MTGFFDSPGWKEREAHWKAIEARIREEWAGKEHPPCYDCVGSALYCDLPIAEIKPAVTWFDDDRQIIGVCRECFEKRDEPWQEEAA